MGTYIIRHKTLALFFAIPLLGACDSNPYRPEIAREEVTTRHARIVERIELSDPRYDQLRREEAENRHARESISKAGFLFGAIGGAIGGVLAPASDSTEYPQRYKFLVKLDATDMREVVDTFPFQVGECVRVATGRTTGKLSLINGYKGECDAIP